MSHLPHLDHLPHVLPGRLTALLGEMSASERVVLAFLLLLALLLTVLCLSEAAGLVRHGRATLGDTGPDEGGALTPDGGLYTRRIHGDAADDAADDEEAVA